MKAALLNRAAIGAEPAGVRPALAAPVEIKAAQRRVVAVASWVFFHINGRTNASRGNRQPLNTNKEWTGNDRQGLPGTQRISLLTDGRIAPMR